MLEVTKEENTAFYGTAAAQGANLQTVNQSNFTRIREISETVKAKFDTFGTSSLRVSRNVFSKDGTDYISFDVSLRFLDSMPLDDVHHQSCLVCLSESEIKTVIEMLKSVVK